MKMTEFKKVSSKCQILAPVIGAFTTDNRVEKNFDAKVLENSCVSILVSSVMVVHLYCQNFMGEQLIHDIPNSKEYLGYSQNSPSIFVLYETLEGRNKSWLP